MEQKTGAAAIGSILAAVVSFFASFSGSPVWGILLALVSVPLGILGLLRASSPRVGGGILSIVAIVLGVLGFIVAFIVLVGIVIL